MNFFWFLFLWFGEKVAYDGGLGDVTSMLNCMNMKLYVTARSGWYVLVTYLGEREGLCVEMIGIG